MKQHVILFFVLILSYSSFCQNYSQDGDKCFDIGDYSCALIKYKEQLKLATESEKLNVEIKIKRAKWCLDQKKTADVAFNEKKFSNAKENYLAILDSNPDDNYAKSQIEKCETFIEASIITTLKLSKTNLYFKTAGGSDNITIETNSKLFSIDLLPAWCTVQKYNGYFTINCVPNNTDLPRFDYFNVKAGNKIIKVNITQNGITKAKDITLNVSKINLNFSAVGGDEDKVTVITNADNFTVILIPYWCVVKNYKDYITVSCKPNTENQSRSSWFKVIADSKEVKLYVTQSAEVKSDPLPEKREKIKKVRRSLYSFSSLGFTGGEVAKYGLLYESGGKRFVGFHMSLRSSLTPEEEILDGSTIENKTVFDLGPNFKIFKRLYINLGVGYGYYDYLNRDDYGGNHTVEKEGFVETSAGLMIRLSRVIAISGGASFINIHEDLYTPEFTVGLSFNLKGKYKY